MKKLLFVAVLLLVFSTAFSQRSFTSFQYSVGFGTGNMHDFISPASFRGFTFDFRSMVSANIGVGVDLGWNVFYDEMPDGVYEYQNVTYAGKQWRYSNHWPILGAVNYFVKPDANVVPYFGLGLGTMYSLQNTDMGTWTFENDAWHFVLRPEVGLLYKTGNGVAFNVVSKYYYGFKAGDLPAQGFLTINFGFVFEN
jgi:hypothetical protein